MHVHVYRRWVPDASYFAAVTLTNADITHNPANAMIKSLQRKFQSRLFNQYNAQVKPDVPVPVPSGPWKAPILAGKDLLMKDYPLTAVGLLAKHDEKTGKVTGFCSGFLVAQNAESAWVVTAAHCICSIKKRRLVRPSELYYHPQVRDGGVPGDFNGGEGYKVVSITVPTWHARLPLVSDRTIRYEKYHSWDVALIQLSLEGTTLPCPQTYCKLSLGYAATNMQHKVRVAGYGNSNTLQLRFSSPWDAFLPSYSAYGYHMCKTYPGHSGSPVYLHGRAPAKGLPNGIPVYQWPAMGVHHGKSKGANAFSKFTLAHLKWFYHAGLNKTNMWGCSSAECVKLKTNKW